MKNNIIYYFLELCIENISYVIIVDSRLFIIVLSKLGVFLYGVKFVYENKDVDDFYIDNVFVIVGCFMMVNNNNIMVVVICWYVVEDVEICYILIEDFVIKFG